ncbi:cation-translocating P-type ATPase [Phenylobacterium soli]|uniref:Cation-translocating P-type ATPase n=1 Tax=Phenylobacterium soli TaxID=2170551 RepID=A0A328ANS0_9CAUL|nr:HAD-IC family P-type ATPase [Phenylobacterium soli]RAK56005.1 cation-translocating P-type ATPase [Phenylobacterium soli]
MPSTSSARGEAPTDLQRLLQGLTAEEAARRLEAFGANRLAVRRTRNVFQIVREAMREPMFLLLLGAVGIYFAMGDPAEALFLLVSSVATIALVVLQEARSERALAALRRLAEPQARVIRDGETRRVAASDLVPGDILLTGEGERLPADATLIAGDVLSLDESALTGESVPVDKTPHPELAADGAGARPGEADGPWLFGGTLVTRGQGVAVVTRTGAATEIGRIGASLAGLDLEAAPLQKVTRRLVRQMGVLALLTSAAVFLLYGVVEGDWTRGALSGITVGIALVPEEFPMVLAIFLALGAFRMAREKVLVRRGAAIETLGAMSVLCVDKTGTLTENRMRVAALWREGETLAPDARSREAERLVQAAALASAPEPVDPMDRAVREMAGARADAGRRPLKTFPLTPQRLAFVQMWREPDGQMLLAAKGAPEAIFRLCRMSAAQAASVEAAVAGFAARGLRVLGVASARLAHDGLVDPAEAAFALEGLVGFEDPVREDVPAALARARAAGVEVAMITGDYPSTALEIARQAGLDVSGGVLSGAEIAVLSQAALIERVQQVRVFARVAPEQKLALVEAFRAGGAVVGMIGDGVNDAPALEAADVGVAMGRRGTDVAREAADLVLLDDRFASIVQGVAHGRRIFANLRAALSYIIAVHVPVAGLALLPVILGMPPVLFPMQVVVLELIIDPMCSVVFEGRRAARGAMARPPRRLGEPLFNGARVLVACLQGVAMLAVAFGLDWGLMALGQGEGAARAAALIAVVGGDLGLAGVVAGLRGGEGRRGFIVTSAVAVALLATALATPWLAALFQFTTPAAWAIALAAGAGFGAGALAGLAGAAVTRGP